MAGEIDRGDRGLAGGERDVGAAGRDAARGGVPLPVGEALVRATLEHRVVSFTYRGLRRTVEPHLLGIHEAGEATLVAYQTSGESRSGDLPGWRTFIVAEIADVVPEDRRFPGPRPDFVPDDERMTEIFARA